MLDAERHRRDSGNGCKFTAVTSLLRATLSRPLAASKKEHGIIRSSRHWGRSGRPVVRGAPEGGKFAGAAKIGRTMSGSAELAHEVIRVRIRCWRCATGNRARTECGSTAHRTRHTHV